MFLLEWCQLRIKGCSRSFAMKKFLNPTNMAKPGQPSQKLFIRDLMSYELCPSLLDSSVKEWRIKPTVNAASSGSRGAVKFVWLQGTVVQCQSADTFTLDDGTGTALVGGCSKIPAVCPRPQQGRYLMVVGELKAGGEIPAVKAFKIQDLSDDHILRQMWPMEVLDMDNFYNS